MIPSALCCIRDKKFKKILKRGKDEIKSLELLNVIATGGNLEPKYKNHKLVNLL